MRISVFGNTDLPIDAVPVCLIPELKKRFPQHEFIHQDPNEECLPPEASAKGGIPWFIIDTVKGIDSVRLLTDQDVIQVTRRVSMHDYDLGMHLSLLKKINPQLLLKIIAVPLGMNAEEALLQVTGIVEQVDEMSTKK